MTDIHIIPLHADDEATIAQITTFMPDAFRTMAPEFVPDEAAALDEIRGMLDPAENINLIAVDSSGVLGWIGGIPTYDGNVYELHPLAVRPGRQRSGVGTALVRALEMAVAARGGLTLYVGSDDVMGTTSLAGIDVYPNPLDHLAHLRDLGGHPYRFYERCGFVLVGLVPDANGFGKPDIFLAKRVGQPAPAKQPN